MTYRNGAYVMDIRENRLAQVIGSTDAHVQVQRPGGGLQWEVPAADLRLATREEREAVGLPASASPVGCTECAAFVAARREAGVSGDEERIVDAMVAVRTHFRDAHVLPYWTRR